MAAYGAGCSSDSGGTAGSGGTAWQWRKRSDRRAAQAAWAATWVRAAKRMRISFSSKATSPPTRRGDRPDCDYILPEGQITYVQDDAILTISPGVTVKGDNQSALIITRGSEIDAQGTGRRSDRDDVFPC